MKNRAKCKLCNTVIESFHSEHVDICACGQISVEGGDSLRCGAKDWNNFIRVDDQGNEIIIKVKNENVKQLDIPSNKPTRKELLGMLDEMIKNIEGLPPAAMTTHITHYDFASCLLLFSSIFRCTDNDNASEI
jgi:hypothetical protein